MLLFQLHDYSGLGWFVICNVAAVFTYPVNYRQIKTTAARYAGTVLKLMRSTAVCAVDNSLDHAAAAAHITGYLNSSAACLIG